tara:strand:- start:834 stop:1100 length:267 start_codon:yes stop_codon:yes gene_type:complete
VVLVNRNHNLNKLKIGDTMLFDENKYGKLEQMHDYDKDDYLLIVNGNVWATSGNDDFYDIDEVAPPPIPKDAQVMVVKVLTIKKEDIS